MNCINRGISECLFSRKYILTWGQRTWHHSLVSPKPHDTWPGGRETAKVRRLHKFCRSGLGPRIHHQPSSPHNLPRKATYYPRHQTLHKTMVPIFGGLLFSQNIRLQLETYNQKYAIIFCILFLGGLHILGFRYPNLRPLRWVLFSSTSHTWFHFKSLNTYWFRKTSQQAEKRFKPMTLKLQGLGS